MSYVIAYKGLTRTQSMYLFMIQNAFSPTANSLIMSINPFVEMSAPHPPLCSSSSWICWEGLSIKPPMGWDIARGKIFVKLQSACVQHIQLKATPLCEDIQLDMQSKRIFNALPLVQIQHAVHSGILILSFAGDRHVLRNAGIEKRLMARHWSTSICLSSCGST